MRHPLVRLRRTLTIPRILTLPLAQENVQRALTFYLPYVEPVQHPLVAELLRPETFDPSRGAYMPTEQLRALYPPRLQGCWMVDAVRPDPVEVNEDEEEDD